LEQERAGSEQHLNSDHLLASELASEQAPQLLLEAPNLRRYGHRLERLPQDLHRVHPHQGQQPHEALQSLRLGHRQPQRLRPQ
jgi:hypothetical protein